MGRRDARRTYPRELGMIVNDSGSAHSIIFQPDGSYAFLDEDGKEVQDTSVSTVIKYKGKNKDRATAMVNSKQFNAVPFFDPRYYDKVYSCDTNTQRDANGINLSASVVTETKVLSEQNGEIEIENHALFFLIWYWTGTANIEPRAWDVCSYLLKEKYKEYGNCLLIVDSEMNDIPEYNQHKKKLPSGRFLPDGFELAYASDKSVDTYLNKAIRLCDKLAGATLNSFSNQSGELFSGFVDGVEFITGLYFHKNEQIIAKTASPAEIFNQI